MNTDRYAIAGYIVIFGLLAIYILYLIVRSARTK